MCNPTGNNRIRRKRLTKDEDDDDDNNNNNNNTTRVHDMPFVTEYKASYELEIPTIEFGTFSY